MRVPLLGFLAGATPPPPASSAKKQPVVIDADRASGAPRWTFSGPRDLNGTAVTDMTVDGNGKVYLIGATMVPIAPRYAIRGASDPHRMRFQAGGTRLPDDGMLSCSPSACRPSRAA